MPRFALPPTGAKDVEMQDGSRYRGRGTLKHGRTIEVADSGHVKALEAQDSINRIADFAGAHLAMDAHSCPQCNFSAWPWQKVCPKCGADI